MSGFGGSIKLTGEDSYRKALTQINQSLREVSSEMKVVSSSYDTNDKSLEALTAQEDVLNKKLDEQEKKLSLLQTEYGRMSTEYETNTKNHESLVKSYESEKEKLAQIEKELGTSSKEYQDQKEKVDALQQEVVKSTKAQDDNEKSMSKMREQINNAQADCNKTSKEIDNLGKETKESAKEAESAGKGFTVFKGILADLGAQAITGAINGLKKLGSGLVSIGKQSLQNYAEFEQLEGGIETLFTPPEGLNAYVQKMGEVGVSAQEAVRKFNAGTELVMKNANEAYKTAGMSANEYMETVTGFSASLLQGLDGDTEKTAKYADQAIKDMSDNANKMGTDMESIQNAYQGFAKGNFNMLDNLKLGYGGTKEEMLRLVKDAGVVSEEVKSIDDVSFDQIIDGIHIVQDRMNITGTTAKEASTTIEGSVKTMKASWTNLLTGIADENSNFEGLVSNFVESIMSVAHNIIPRVKNIMDGIGELATGLISELLPELITMFTENFGDLANIAVELISTLGNGILQALPTLMPVVLDIITTLTTNLIDALPQIIETGITILVSLIDGLTKALPKLIEMLPTIITTTVTTLLKNINRIITAGIELLKGIIQGLTKALPQLIKYLPEIITTICDVLVENLPFIIQSAVEIVVALIKGIVKALPDLAKAVPQIITTIVTAVGNLAIKLVQLGKELIIKLVNGIKENMPKVKEKAGEIKDDIINKVKELPSKMLNIGTDLVRGVWNGISNGTQWLKNRITEWVGDVTAFIKKVFKIGSPSKLMEDEVGQWLAKGIGVGFEDEMQDVEKQMADAIPTSFDVSTSVKGSKSNQSYFDMVKAFKQALSEMKIELDDQQVGQFVDKTVSRLIYT
jgi:phage-related protein